MIRYLAAGGTQVVELTDNALVQMTAHVQSRTHMAEAGGQLFAVLEEGVVRVVEALGPSCVDKRSRYSFEPSSWVAQRRIKAMHRRGLHYVGDWHTHPERLPTPSSDDRRAVLSLFKESRHALAGFLMVIVGTASAPEGLYVAIGSPAGVSMLVPLEAV